MTKIHVEHYRSYRIVACEQDREFLVAIHASTNLVLKSFSVPKSAGVTSAFAAGRQLIDKEWDQGNRRNQKAAS